MEVLEQMGLAGWQVIAIAVVVVVLVVVSGLVVWAMAADWDDGEEDGWTQPLQDAIDENKMPQD